MEMERLLCGGMEMGGEEGDGGGGEGEGLP
jgi:hypothetical protein